MEGIYTITCTENNRVYVGRSKDIEKRWKSHLNSLRSENHINKQLLKDYQEYGEESFKFEVVKETDNMIDNKREESCLYYQLKESGVELYNEAQIIDYRSISREESEGLCEEIVNRTTAVLAENKVDRHDWEVRDIAEQLNVSYDDAVIAVKEHLHTNLRDDKYIIQLSNDYSEYTLRYFESENFFKKMEDSFVL